MNQTSLTALMIITTHTLTNNNMTKSYETLDELVEENAKEAEKAKEIVAKSQAKRLKDEHIWRRSYDNAH